MSPFHTATLFSLSFSLNGDLYTPPATHHTISHINYIGYN